MDRLGLVSVSFRQAAPEQILEKMADTCLKWIEWGSDVHAPAGDRARLQQLAQLQARYGIGCCSYGTYFRLGQTPMAELPAYMDAAQTLGTSVLRLWCGTKNSQDYTPVEQAQLLSLCKEAAQLAQQRQLVLCMECHQRSYTNRPQAAKWMMDAVDSPHFRMYWQPDQFRAEEENLASARLLAPYTRHLHVFNWREKERFPLEQGLQTWQRYLTAFGQERTLLLEFMPDDRLETLPREARALSCLAGGAI